MKPEISAFAVSICLFAAGCAPHYDAEAARREQARQDSQTCIGYGTVIDTPAYNNCMRDLERRDVRDYDGRYVPPPPPPYYAPRDEYYYRR